MSIHIISLKDSDGSHESIVLFPGITYNELVSIVNETFPNNCSSEIVGITDESRSVYFPLSMLCENPFFFVNKLYYLHRSGDFVQNVLTEGKTKETEFGNEGKSIPIGFIDAYIQIIIDEVRSHTGLHEYGISDIIVPLSEATLNSELSEKQFIKTMTRLINQDIYNLATAIATYRRIYLAISNLNYNTVNIYQLYRVLLVFCNGKVNWEDNVNIIFYLFDRDEDKAISESDMNNFFLEVLEVLYVLFADIFIMTSVSAPRLASLLTSHAFMYRSYFNVITMDREIFCSWFESKDHFLLISEGVRSSNSGTYHEVKFEEVKRKLNLSGITLQTIDNYITMYVTDDTKFVSRSNFLCAFCVILRSTGEDVFQYPPEELLALETVINSLFQLFDTWKSDYIHHDDILCCLSVFCHGDWYEKLHIIYRSATGALALAGADARSGGGYIVNLTRMEMVELLTILFRITLKFNKFDYAEQDVNDVALIAEDIIQYAVDDKELPERSSGIITTIEFAYWLGSLFDVRTSSFNVVTDKLRSYLKQCGVGLSASDMHQSVVHAGTSVWIDTSDNGHDEEEDDEEQNRAEEVEDCQLKEEARIGEESKKTVTRELCRAKSLLGLEGFTVVDVMDILGENSIGGVLTLSAWLRVVSHLRWFGEALDSHDYDDNEDDTDETAASLAEMIFEYFASAESDADNDNDGEEAGEATLSYIKLMTSLLILCDSPPEDKMGVAYSLYKEEEFIHNYVTLDAIKEFIGTVLAMTCLCSNMAREHVDVLDVDFEELAEKCAGYCLQVNNLLDQEEFGLDDFCLIGGTCLQLA